MQRRMADPLSRTYLPLLKQDIVDREDVWSVADTRPSTKFELGYVDNASLVCTHSETNLAVNQKCHFS